MTAKHTPGRLWLYTNLIGVHGWAESKTDFIRRYPDAKDGAAIVRCAHIGVVPPPGYRKGKDELAFTPVERI